MIQTGRSLEERQNTYAYKAFISYSHRDEKAAKALHRKLENFRIPKSLGLGLKALRPIFRDRDDLSVSSGLNGTLREALRQSETLIVLCSPKSASSRWVNDEIIYFKELGREDSIYTVILDGEPFASDRSNETQPECLPKAIRYELAQNGELSQTRAEPLAADFRPQGDGKKLGFLKLVSGLLGVKLDNLVRRDLANARRRFAAVVTSSAVMVSIMGSLTWFALDSQKEAYARKTDAENFVEFMLSDLREDLETFGRLDLMESIGDKAAGYYAQFDAADLAADYDSNGRRARALHLIGEIKYDLGATHDAVFYFSKAHTITLRALELAPSDSDRIKEHAMSAYLRSKTERRRENRVDEKTFLEEYAHLAKRLSGLEPESQETLLHLGRAKTNLGRLNLNAGHFDAAMKDLKEADKLFMDVADQSPDVEITLNHAENLAWLAEVYRISKALTEAHHARQRQVDVLQAAYLRLPKDFRVLEGLVYAKIGLGNAARGIKDYEAALASHKFVLTKANEALEVEPGREKMMRAKVGALEGLMNASLENGDFDSCKTYRQQIEMIQNDSRVTSLSESLYWTRHLPKSLSSFDAKFSEAVLGSEL